MLDQPLCAPRGRSSRCRWQSKPPSTRAPGHSHTPRRRCTESPLLRRSPDGVPSGRAESRRGSRRGSRVALSCTFQRSGVRRERDAIARLEEIAWQAYTRAARRPSRARPGRLCRPRVRAVRRMAGSQGAHRESAGRLGTRRAPSRVLLICGSARNDGSCPGEMSKTFRLAELRARGARAAGMRSICWI